MSSILRGSYNFLWDLSKPLGQGATSMVYRGRNKSTGEEVAVKVFTQAGNLRPKDVQMREYEVMRKLKHKNIVALLAIEEEQGSRNKVIVMELTDHGSLFNLLEDPKNAYGLPEEEFLIVFEHVSAGMKCIKDNGIVHRDIKPGNILRYIGEDGKSIYRLTDFGAAKQLETEEEQFMSLYGTEEYLHPDIYERAVLRNPMRRQFTSTVDLWSLGVTFFHVATGQLPFKPFGGRKNRTKMFEITSHKESGVIMGIQHTEGGPIDWSRDLPPTCRLSLGLKLLITPIFAKLLESNPARVWNFDQFFISVDNIVRKKVVHVFNPHSWSNLRIYIGGESKLSELEEHIAAQTDIIASSQILLFDGQPFKERVQPLLPISSYPNEISVNNPIFCFTKRAEDSCRFPHSVIREFPKFTASMTSEDYSLAKMCSAIVCYIFEEVKRYNSRQELMRRSVHAIIQDLYHECDHLVDYYRFLERNCDSVLRWKNEFLRSNERELNLITLLHNQTNLGSEHLLELKTFHDNCQVGIDDISRQVIVLKDEVESKLQVLQNQQLQKKELRKLWNDSQGCTNEDRCISKVNVVVDSVLRIKTQFGEDRKKVSLSFNEEQIHKYEKNRLSENCIKVKSLFFDHCVKGAEGQFRGFQTWYRAACSVRYQSEETEKLLKRMADSLENLVQTMSQMSTPLQNGDGPYLGHCGEKSPDQVDPAQNENGPLLWDGGIVLNRQNHSMRQQCEPTTSSTREENVYGFFKNPELVTPRCITPGSKDGKNAVEGPGIMLFGKTESINEEDLCKPCATREDRNLESMDWCPTPPSDLTKSPNLSVKDLCKPCATREDRNLESMDWCPTPPSDLTKSSDLSVKQFKPRCMYFCIRQQADQTYNLEYFRDQRKSEVKGAIYLDLAQEIVKVNFRRGSLRDMVQEAWRTLCHTNNKLISPGLQHRAKQTTVKPGNSNAIDEVNSLKELSDDDINNAQKLLRAPDLAINGLKDIATLFVSTDKVETPYVQILSVNGNHWVTISARDKEGPVKVFDSGKQPLSESAIELIKKYHGYSCPIYLMNTQKQQGQKDCGLFAIANATALCHKLDPTVLNYHQQEMREHFKKCLQEKKMTLFPYQICNSRVKHPYKEINGQP